MYDEPPPPRGQASPPGREPEGTEPVYGRDSVSRISPGASRATYAPVGAATTTTSVVATEPVGPAPALMLVLGLLAGLLIGLVIAYAIFHSSTG